MQIPDPRAANEETYAFTDIETTGTNLDKDCVLEVACIVTDGRFREKGRFQSLVSPKQSSLDQMGDYVRNMHTENGLLAELEGTRPLMGMVEKDFAKFLKRYKNPDAHMYIAGNSVGSLDIPFLRKYAPRLWQHSAHKGPLHYRYFCVSSFGIGIKLATGVYPEITKPRGHRAMEDIEECIKEAKSYFDFVAEHADLFLR